VIRKSAASVAAAVLLAGGLAIPPVLDTDDTIPAPPIGYAAAEPPQFRIQWRQHKLALAGHTLSTRHEQSLAEAAESYYPGATVVAEFKPQGIVPVYWEGVTVQALRLLGETRDAEADISPSGIEVRAVVDDELKWQNRLTAVRIALPADIRLTTNIIFVDHDISVADLCERAFRTFVPGNIEFRESGTELRSAAYPRLDRVVALGRACRLSRIRITGHTDGSGNAAYNQALSLKRAQRVADYLADAGIVRDRLVVSGAGASNPIADNSTRHGRSLNRRIDIIFEQY
jgi:OOP family OmpA-OmpF porin